MCKRWWNDTRVCVNMSHDTGALASFAQSTAVRKVKNASLLDRTTEQ